MTLIPGIVKELQHEAASTRKMLERVTDEQFDWQPHLKSTSLGKLAAHVANTTNWVNRIMESEELDVATGFKPQPPVTTVKEILERHAANVESAKTALEAASQEDMMKPWIFKHGEKVFFTLPRVAAIRNMALNHMVHHRGQLSVYLRLLDIPVPGMYGQTADEKQ